MSTITLSSDEARREWRELLERAYMDRQAAIIKRWNKPIAVLVNFDHYNRLLELERVAEYRKQIADVLAGNGTDLDAIA